MPDAPAPTTTETPENTASPKKREPDFVVNFNHANLTGVNFKDSSFRYSTFLKTNLAHANMARASMTNCKFNEATLDHLKLPASGDISNRQLMTCDFTGTIFGSPG